MAQDSTGSVLLAWHLAVSGCGIEHTWRDLLCLLRYHETWTQQKFVLIRLLHHAILECAHEADPFRYAYDGEWATDAVRGCFCRMLDYQKLRALLCDAGDLYVLEVLLECRKQMAEMVCLSLGYFANDMDGVSRALAAKETVRLLQYMGLLASAQMIVYLDTHGHTTVAVLAERAEVHAVQFGLLIQLDAQQRIEHRHHSILVIMELFKHPAAFRYADWKVLSAFAILIARCCDHSGDLLLHRRICNLAPVPVSWANRGSHAIVALHDIICACPYTKDTIQLCANLLLELDEQGEPTRPPHSAGQAEQTHAPHSGSADARATALVDFFDELVAHVFGPRTSSDGHSCDKRWVSMVPQTTCVDVPTGSEHEYICCALTTHIPLCELKQIVSPSLSKFIEFDQKVDQRLNTRPVASGSPVREVYDVDQFFEGLNLHRQYNHQAANADGIWHTPDPPQRQTPSNFKSFRL